MRAVALLILGVLIQAVPQSAATETVLTFQHHSPERTEILLGEARLGELRREENRTTLIAATEIAALETTQSPVEATHPYPVSVQSRARLAGNPVEVREQFTLLAPPAPLWIEGLGLEVLDDPPGLNEAEHERIRSWLAEQGLPRDTQPFEERHETESGRELTVWYEIAGRRSAGRLMRSDRPEVLAAQSAGFRRDDSGLKIHHKRPGENGRFTYHRKSLELASSFFNGDGDELTVHECGCYGYAIAADFTTLDGDTLYQVEADWQDDRVAAEFFVGWKTTERFPWFGLGDRRRMRDLARRVHQYNLRDAAGAAFATIEMELSDDPSWPDLGNVTYRVSLTTTDGSMRPVARIVRTVAATTIHLEGEKEGWEEDLNTLDRLLAAMPIQVQRGDGIRDSHLGQIEAWVDWVRLLKGPSLEILSDLVSDVDGATATRKIRRLLDAAPGRFKVHPDELPPRPYLENLRREGF